MGKVEKANQNLIFFLVFAILKSKEKAMARTTKIVNFSLPPEIYKEVEELARQRDTSRSQVLREALKRYVACF